LSRETENALLYHKDVIASISSFSVAILAAGSIELMFTKNDVLKITLFLITLTLIAIGLLGFYFSLKINNPHAYFVAIPIALFALFVWWIANAENANLTKNFFKEQSKTSQELNKSLDQYEVQ
jgi:amino acid transporter